MNQEQNAVAMLHMFTHPVFAAENGTVIMANAAAKQLSISEGQNLLQWLETGRDEYSQFQGGALSLTLCIDGLRYIATVLRSENADIFHLQTGFEEDDLRSLALTAQCMREPLANMMTITDLLFSKEAYSEEKAAHTSQLNRSAYQMLRILSNMTDAASCKDRTYNMEVLDLSAISRTIAEAAKTYTESTNRRILFEGLNQPVYTLCDRDMLERAFYNLLSNAIKFSPEHSTIKVKMTQTGNQVLLSLQNKAERFTAEDLGTVFFRYRRHPGLEDGRNGVGLGIPMVRSAVAAHKGTLLLTQDSEGNVCFTMSIAIRSESAPTLRSHITTIDYAGGRSHGLLELSEVLAPSFYENIN